LPLIAGLIVMQEADGKLKHFEILGYVCTGTILFSLIMMYTIHRQVPEKVELKL
jgi:hypothetical protein